MVGKKACKHEIWAKKYRIFLCAVLAALLVSVGIYCYEISRKNEIPKEATLVWRQLQ